jgi:hypothetical protein
MTQHLRSNSIAHRDIEFHLHSQTNPALFEERGLSS